MLIEESLPTLRPVPGVDAGRYVEQSLDRLRNTAIRHRNHQIATDGSQKIVQRLLNPIAERLRRGQGIELLSVPVAAWMVYLIRSSDRFGKSWTVSDPYADADRRRSPTGSATTPRRWPREILAIDTIFDRALAANAEFRQAIVAGLEGLLSDQPLAYVRRICESPANVGSGASGAGRPARTMWGGGHEAWSVDGAVSGRAARAGRGLGCCCGLRGAGDRLLAEIGWPEPPLCRHQPHRRRQPFGVAKAREIAAALSDKKLAISALGYYPNPLHPDPAHRQTVIDHLKKVIVAASRMGVAVVNTFCGGDAAQHQDANWQRGARRSGPTSSPMPGTTASG